MGENRFTNLKGYCIKSLINFEGKIENIVCKRNCWITYDIEKGLVGCLKISSRS